MLRTFLASMAAVLAAGFVFSAGAVASPWSGGCAWDAQTHSNDCMVSSPYGLAYVLISVQTPRGVMIVADESFNCESRVKVHQVSVHWQGDYPIHEIDAGICASDEPVDAPMAEQPPTVRWSASQT